MAGKRHAHCADRVEDGSMVTIWKLSRKFDSHPATGDADVTLDFSMTSSVIFARHLQHSVIICTIFLNRLLQMIPTTSSMVIRIRRQK